MIQKTVRFAVSVIVLFLLCPFNPSPAFADSGVEPPSTPAKAERGTKENLIAQPGGADLPVKITGDSVEYFYAEKRAVGKGNIHIDYKGSVLTADEVEVNLATKEATSRGNVTLEQDGAVYTGQYVLINLETKSADISKAAAKIAPYYMAKGERVEKIGDEYYKISDGFVTTCEGPLCEEKWVPPYRIQSREVLFYPKDKVVIKNAVFYIKDVPFFYIPIMIIPILDADRFPIQVQVGSRDEWGMFALSKYRYFVSPDFKGNLLFDVREKQKYAGGAESFYNTHTLGKGAARFYYADDRCGDDTDCSRGDSDRASVTDRYRAQLRHQWDITPDTSVNMEVNKLSDEYLIKDFFYRDEYEKLLQPDNYVSVIHAQDEFTLSVLNRYRLDDFYGVTERTPEVRFDTHARNIPDTPIYYRTEVQASKLNKLYAYSTDGHNEANRVDMRQTLSYVWKIAPWTLTPYAAMRETYYSRDIEEDADFVRTNMETGMELTTKFFKVYDANFNALGMSFGQLRHIVTPGIGYRYQSKPTHVKESLYSFDNIDALDHESYFRYTLENKFQTKPLNAPEGAPSRTLLRSLVYADMKIPQAELTKFTEITFDNEFYPNDRLTLDTTAEYNIEMRGFRYVNADIIYRLDPFSFGIGQRIYKKYSNQTTAQIGLTLNKDVSLTAYGRHEFEDQNGDEIEDHKTDEFEVTLLLRNIVCWTTQFTYNYDGGNNFFVTFSPSTFEETSFHPSQYYRSPIESSFLNPGPEPYN